MANITLKFGGSSMCYDGFQTILTQINNNLNQYNTIFLIVSAIKNTTTNLYQIINYEKNTLNDIIKDHYDLLNKLKLDSHKIDDIFQSLKNDIDVFIQNSLIDITQQKIKIISYGEILSSTLLFIFLKNQNMNIKLINARNIIKSQKNSSQIDPNNLNLKGPFYCDANKLNFMLENNINIYLTQGFIVSTSDDKYGILSRSGSDTTASLIAAGIKSDKLEIWTDVNGMYTADPRIVKESKLIKNINYDVCQELSASGSYVLHPYCIKPCKEKNIPIHIKNTFCPNNNDHTIVSSYLSEISNNIYAISIKKNITVFKIESFDMWEGDGFVSDIFNVFTKNNVGVDIITTSQFSITTTTEENAKDKINHVFNTLSNIYDVQLITNCNIISITADNIMNNSYLHKIIPLVNNICDNLLYINHYSSNNLTLSLVVDHKIAIKLLNILHQELF
jgi:aspartate kinase